MGYISFSMIRNRNLFHFYVYFGGIILLAASLPLSPFVLTLSQIIITLNWLAEGNLKNKMRKIWQRKSVFIFLLLFAAHLLWLINTTDFAYAFRDIKIKLPLLILPVIMGTSRALRENQVKIILLAFTGAIVASSLVSIYHLSIITWKPMSDVREISVFISHIRFSLLVNIAIFSLIYLLMTETFRWNRALRNILWATLVWLILFLFILQSLTGIIIFILTSFIFLIMFSPCFENRYWYIRTPLLYGISALLTAILIYSVVIIFSFSTKETDPELLKTYTPSGNTYMHDTWNKQMENGNYVWININEQELAQQWNRRSSIDYRGLDNMGHELRHTLIRYLTSLGYDKDAASVSRLTETDIRNIENGMANHIYQHNKWIYPRIYQVIWEIDNYRKGGNPTGHSIAQRIEYWKAGIDIVARNFWFGTGTGDVALAFERQYEESETLLSPEWQLRAHNQFLTFLISFGIAGFLLAVFSMTAPFFIEKRQAQMMPFIFAIVVILSMITEDTLETQAGATFFVFFYALFIFAQDKCYPDNGKSAY